MPFGAAQAGPQASGLSRHWGTSADLEKDGGRGVRGQSGMQVVSRSCLLRGQAPRGVLHWDQRTRSAGALFAYCMTSAHNVGLLAVKLLLPWLTTQDGIASLRQLRQLGETTRRPRTELNRKVPGVNECPGVSWRAGANEAGPERCDAPPQAQAGRVRGGQCVKGVVFVFLWRERRLKASGLS